MSDLSVEVLESVSTPDRVESRLGALEFTDGAPSAKTVETLYDHLDFVHGAERLPHRVPGGVDPGDPPGLPRASACEDNSVLIFSELMDSSSRFLTANADTVYYIAFIDLTDGPMVVETPPMALGTFDDMWFQWIIDFGLPGPDRGAGGKFLLVPPGYDGTTARGRLLRRPLAHEPRADARPVVHGGRRSRAHGRDHQVDAQGVPLRTGRARHQRRHPPPRRLRCPHPRPTVPETTFVEGSGLTFNTIPPNDVGFFETVNALLQDEAAGATDPEILGHLAEIGIVKGKPFAPDERMRRILDDAATVGNATARALMFDSRGEEDVAFYPGSAWTNMLFGGGYLFDDADPEVTPEGIKPYPPTGARKHDLRTLFFYGYTGITPAMAMRLTGLGSQYLVTFLDSNKEYFDGAQVVHGDAAVRTFPRRGSGRSRCTTTRPARCSSRPSGTRAPAASRIHRLPRFRTTTARPPCTSRPSNPPASPTATGSRPRRARGTSPSSGSTARSSRSSTSRGVSERSSRRSEHPPRGGRVEGLGHRNSPGLPSAAKPARSYLWSRA